jgi:hypothetical protein
MDDLPVLRTGAGGRVRTGPKLPIFRAHDEKLDRDVALKVQPEGSLADERARSRFYEEANALSRLSLLKALDKDPELGHQTAKDLRVDLEGLQLRPDSRPSGSGPARGTESGAGRPVVEPGAALGAAALGDDGVARSRSIRARLPPS